MFKYIKSHIHHTNHQVYAQINTSISIKIEFYTTSSSKNKFITLIVR